jgi:hypothetical protein
MWETEGENIEWSYLTQDGYQWRVTVNTDGFGGKVVSMLASGSRVRGFEPDRSRWIFFRCEKILSMPSFGGEVK